MFSTTTFGALEWDIPFDALEYNAVLSDALEWDATSSDDLERNAIPSDALEYNPMSF